MDEWQGFYSIAQVSRLAQIPRRTLYEWRKRGIIEPSLEVAEDGEIVDYGYSYADLTIIKIMRLLRKDRLDLTSVGNALKHLYERLGPPNKGWADAQVYIVGKKIFALLPDEWETTMATQFGQKVDTRMFGDLFSILKEQEEEGAILIPNDYLNHVEINPNVMGGNPVVRGTRVPTSILAMLGRKGKSLEDIANLYHPIPKETIAKAIEYERFLDCAA
jgi:uncharacterized protein (DUF433 family)/DNA-binding transcriptional MerR regulator